MKSREPSYLSKVTQLVALTVTILGHLCLKLCHFTASYSTAGGERRKSFLQPKETQHMELENLNSNFCICPYFIKILARFQLLWPWFPLLKIWIATSIYNLKDWRYSNEMTGKSNFIAVKFYRKVRCFSSGGKARRTSAGQPFNLPSLWAQDADLWWKSICDLISNFLYFSPFLHS